MTTFADPVSAPPLTTLSSKKVDVLRDAVEQQTTPHEVYCPTKSLDGVVASVALPTTKLVFVKYGGDVVVSAPPTGDKLVATVPLGPMGVSHKVSGAPEYRNQGFLLSSTQDTIMRPDPGKGALVFAVDSAEIAQQAEKVLGHDRRFGQFHRLNRQALVERSLTQMCTGAWEMAMSLPADTPEFVVSRLMNSMQLNIINSLILACDHTTVSVSSENSRMSRLITWIQQHAGDCITVADLAAEIGLSVRQLQASVALHFGITPLELLRETRLRLVRAELVAADPEASTVSSIAYSFGFNHLGRFSHHYYIAFGEKPSETFRVNQHD
jgi:AraC-like DNA-binding protein